MKERYHIVSNAWNIFSLECLDESGRVMDHPRVVFQHYKQVERDRDIRIVFKVPDGYVTLIGLDNNPEINGPFESLQQALTVFPVLLAVDCDSESVMCTEIDTQTLVSMLNPKSGECFMEFSLLANGERYDLHENTFITSEKGYELLVTFPIPRYQKINTRIPVLNYDNQIGEGTFVFQHYYGESIHPECAIVIEWVGLYLAYIDGVDMFFRTAESFKEALAGDIDYLEILEVSTDIDCSFVSTEELVSMLKTSYISKYVSDADRFTIFINKEKYILKNGFLVPFSIMDPDKGE